MQAGKARNYITIEKSTYTLDSYNARIEEWKTYTECWSNCRPLGGKEAFTMAQFYPTVERVFQIRYESGITPKMRILHDGSYHDILSVIDRDGKRAELTIYTQVFST